MTATPPSDIALYWNDDLASELLRFLTKRLKCSDTAAEIMQETFLRFHRFVTEAPPDNARALAYQIALSVSEEYQRKANIRGRQQATETRPPHAVPDPVQAERLYREHYSALKVFLLRRSSSEDLTETLLQEVYLRLMEIRDLTSIRHPGAYMTRLAYHLLVDHTRRQRLEQGYFADVNLDDPEGFTAPALSPVPDEQAHYAQVWAAYDRLLRELPPPTREVLLLNKVQGLTHSEIARRFGISKSWVEKLVAKAILYCQEHGPEIDF